MIVDLPELGNSDSYEFEFLLAVDKTAVKDPERFSLSKLCDVEKISSSTTIVTQNNQFTSTEVSQSTSDKQESASVPLDIFTFLIFLITIVFVFRRKISHRFI